MITLTCTFLAVFAIWSRLSLLTFIASSIKLQPVVVAVFLRIHCLTVLFLNMAAANLKEPVVDTNSLRRQLREDRGDCMNNSLPAVHPHQYSKKADNNLSC